MRSRRDPRPPAEVAKRAEGLRFKREQLAEMGRPLAPSRKTRHAAAAVEVAPAAERTLAAAGVVIVGELVAVRRGLLGVELEPPPAQPKPRRVEAPAWLAVVRAMPCSRCGAGRPFIASLGLVGALGWRGVAQSEPNHHPARGPTGGGSDLETHPLCRACHRTFTDHRPTADGPRRGMILTAVECEAAVGQTLLLVVRAVRDGYLSPAILIAAGVEAVIGD